MKMNTRLLMASSAISLTVIGLCLTFFATEIADFFLLNTTIVFQLFNQVLGALYFAFAMLNWMAKGNVIGGIYNRPIVIANLSHFLVGGLALVKGLMKHPELPWAIWIVAAFCFVYHLRVILWNDIFSFTCDQQGIDCCQLIPGQQTMSV